MGEKLPFDLATDTNPAVLRRLRELAEYDVVIVDTPGSLESTDVLRAVIEASDYVILPTEPAGLSVAPLIKTIQRLVVPSGKPYRVLLNKVDPRSLTTAEEARQMLLRKNVPTFNVSVRHYVAHRDAPTAGEVVTQYSGDRHSAQAIDDYRRVALELFAEWSRATDTAEAAGPALREVN